MKTDGYVALISAIIISAVLLTALAAASLLGFTGRFNILNSEFKEQSAALAEACLDFAALKLTEDSGYTGREVVVVGSDACEIRSIEDVGAAKKVQTQAVFQKSYTNLEALVDPLNGDIISWREIETF